MVLDITLTSMIKLSANNSLEHTRLRQVPGFAVHDVTLTTVTKLSAKPS